MAENTIQWDKDADGIVTLTLDDPTGSANVMNEHYSESMHKAVERLVAEKDSITGVVITSAKKTFFAGGDLKGMIQAQPGGRRRVLQHGRGHQDATCARSRPSASRSSPPSTAPRSAAAWRSRWRVTTASPPTSRALVVGFPEVTLGLLPGGGGVTRTVRMFGIQNAFMNVLSQGTRFKPAQAKEIGLVDEVLPTVEELVPAAKAWIKANPDSAHPAVGCEGLQDARRHPVQPGAGRASCRRSRRCCASSSRVRRCPRRGPSWTRPSRARRWTSTPPAASRAATSRSWSPARSPRT